MNSLVIILIAMAVLVAGYVFYGRWLAKKWGIDEKAKTPAFTHEDGEDFVPSSKFTVFSHQFSSIAGAGPVTGPILASGEYFWWAVLIPLSGMSAFVFDGIFVVLTRRTYHQLNLLIKSHRIDDILDFPGKLPSSKQ